MLQIEISFLCGRYHATPWGRHVNEAAPEWPPSPYRFVRALIDAWKRKRPEWPESRVRPLLEALSSAAPAFALPPATAMHTRSYLSENLEDPSQKKLVFDGFVVVGKADPLVLGWPEVQLDNQQARDLGELLSLVDFLGRSESWVAVRIPIDRHEPRWDCLSEDRSPDRMGDHVRVPCPIASTSYQAAPFAVPGKGRRAKPVQVDWLEALCWGTAELLDTRRSEPPAMRWVEYIRPSGSLEPKRRKAPATSRRVIHGALYALVSAVPPRVTAAVEVAEQVRRRLMGTHKRIVGDPEKVSRMFSGKDLEGRPLTAQRHPYYLPLDRDADGRLDHLLVVGSEALDANEVKALDLLTRLWQSKGKPEVRCLLLRAGSREELLDAPSRRFRSITPFIPTRHHRKGRGSYDEWMVAEVLREARNHHLPEPTRVVPMERCVAGSHPLHWFEFRRNRRKDAPRTGFGFEIEFGVPVQGPFGIGYGAHFGLGVFAAFDHGGEAGGILTPATTPPQVS
jgi:CRISPR-associated protein Csb2